MRWKGKNKPSYGSQNKPSDWAKIKRKFVLAPPLQIYFAPRTLVFILGWSVYFEPTPPRTIVGPFRHLPGSLYKWLVIHFRSLVFLISGMMMFKLWWNSMSLYHAAISELPIRRWALRAFSAETWLTVYRRRLVSDLNMIVRFYFCDFSGMANLFWL